MPVKTDVITISSQGNHMEEAISQADKVAAYESLSSKSALHLRLLTEETLGLMRAITGTMDGEFWIQNDSENYELHLKVRTMLDEARREQLIAASTSGVNEARRGFMGKIRAFFDAPGSAPTFRGVAVPFAAPQTGDTMTWSLEDYREQLRQSREQNAASAEAWDELEKSVVARLADEVKVSITGRVVEMTIFKHLN